MVTTPDICSSHQSIQSFRDLLVYQESFRLQQMIFALSKGFPREECYSLTNQIRRSSRSIGANISEAWQKRRYENHFVSKLSDADAEQAEVQHWLDTALACSYIAIPEHDHLVNSAKAIGRMLGSMMKAPQKFCRNEAR